MTDLGLSPSCCICLRITQSFFRFPQAVGKERLHVGHTLTPSVVIVTTIGEDRSGEFSISSLVKMSGEITR